MPSSKQCRFMALLFVFVLHLLVTWFVFRGIMFPTKKEEDDDESKPQEEEEEEEDKQRRDVRIMEHVSYEDVEGVPFKVLTIVVIGIVGIQFCYFTLYLLFLRHLCDELDMRYIMLIDWKMLGAIIPSLLVATLMGRVVKVYFTFVGDKERIRDVDLVLLFSIYVLSFVVVFGFTSRLEFLR